MVNLKLTMHAYPIVMDRTLLVALALIAMPAHAQCRLCAPASTATASTQPLTPLNISVEAGLDFSRAALGPGGRGTIALDERSGARAVSGMVDLGGVGLKGEVALSGAPFARVRISVPPSIRLTAPDGGVAEVTVETDLGPDPVLDAQGRLAFGFGGKLTLSGGGSGDFRGLIPITVDYR